MYPFLNSNQGKYCSIRRMEYPEFQIGKFGRMESAQGFLDPRRLRSVFLIEKTTYVLRHRFKLNCLKNCFHHVLAPNTIQITSIKFAQELMVVQRLLIQNNPERPFVKML